MEWISLASFTALRKAFFALARRRSATDGGSRCGPSLLKGESSRTWLSSDTASLEACFAFWCRAVYGWGTLPAMMVCAAGESLRAHSGMLRKPLDNTQVHSGLSLSETYALQREGPALSNCEV